MSLRSKFGFSLVVLCTFGVLVLFNNCQPMEGIGNEGSVGDVDDPPSNPGNPTPARAYFDNFVRPQFNARCVSCHTALPKDVVGGPQGPMTIFDYTTMKTRTSSGPTSNNNYLLNKMRNILSHAGGNGCPGDTTGSISPCREAKTWIEMEYPLLRDGVAGAILSINAMGSVYGWALDTRNQTTQIPVQLYVGGPVGTGTLVATVTANQAGSGLQNGHYFTYDLPAMYRDGVPRALYAYGMTATPENLFPGMPVNFAAYQVSDEGRAFYNANVLPQMNVCMGCHAVNYDLHFLRLLDPTPFRGGTATNNLLIDRMAGIMHVRNVCPGGKNNGPCATVQQWWQIEFGP